ncbi:MAG: HD-GYP domain-containing protein [Clostridium sp.]|jgi:putative nucleotidyltransferase with HDIG domain|nr:HD-GYP domain-containing protein [Clostridium sp.]
MQNLSVLSLESGMVVAKDVHSGKYELLIPKGSVLTEDSIWKLSRHNVTSVYVEELSDELSSKIRSSSEFQAFTQHYEAQISFLKDNLNTVVETHLPLSIDSLVKNVMKLLLSCDGRANILLILENMRAYDDSTYAHSLNVALLCSLMATWLKMSKEDTEMLTVCGLLHDIGKLLIPNSITTKPAKLTQAQYEEMKRHPLLGYQLLYSQNIDSRICEAALLHHERTDGSGYPFGRKSWQIPAFAKIVAIADVYDAMTANRVYRGPICPFNVIKSIEDEAFQKYEVAYVLTFLEQVAMSYINDSCRLSNGLQGKIVYLDKHHLSRPTVQCGSEYVDLTKHPDLTIEAML